MEAVDLLLKITGHVVSDDSRKCMLALLRRVEAQDSQESLPPVVQRLNRMLVHDAQVNLAQHRIIHREAA